MHMCAGACAAGERVAVAKLQVGLLGSARALQRQLDRIASRADTSSPAGLHYILQGASLLSGVHIWVLLPWLSPCLLAAPCMHVVLARCTCQIVPRLIEA